MQGQRKCSYALFNRVKQTVQIIDTEYVSEETSRTVIRAAWLRLLPGVHLRSIHQLFWLGP